MVTVDPEPETLTLSPVVESVTPLLIVMTQLAAAASLMAVELLLETVTGQAVADAFVENAAMPTVVANNVRKVFKFFINRCLNGGLVGRQGIAEV